MNVRFKTKNPELLAVMAGKARGYNFYRLPKRVEAPVAVEVALKNPGIKDAYHIGGTFLLIDWNYSGEKNRAGVLREIQKNAKYSY